jgi:hypothetical protein
MTCPNRSRISPCGFTLIETMVLIGIIGLMAAIALPAFNSFTRANRLDTTASMIASDMAIARATSIAQGRVIRFAATATGYTIDDPLDGRILRDRTFEGSVQLPGAVTIHFFPWGSAETAILTLGDGSCSKEVSVLPTGIVEVGS